MVLWSFSYESRKSNFITLKSTPCYSYLLGPCTVDTLSGSRCLPSPIALCWWLAASDVLEWYRLALGLGAKWHIHSHRYVLASCNSKCWIGSICTSVECCLGREECEAPTQWFQSILFIIHMWDMSTVKLHCLLWVNPCGFTHSSAFPWLCMWLHVMNVSHWSNGATTQHSSHESTPGEENKWSYKKASQHTVKMRLHYHWRCLKGHWHAKSLLQKKVVYY